MKMDVWLQVVLILMAILGFIFTLVPAITVRQRWKFVYFIVFLALGVAEVALAYKQSNEAEERYQLTQQKLDRSLSQQQSLLVENRSLKDQNRDLDAQLTAIRKIFGVPAEFHRDISETVRTEVGVSATVEKGPSQGAQGGR